MEIWSGFIVGLFGSFHCIGMCGPIVIALPFSGESRVRILIERVLYNFGRIVTYSLMGAMFGLFGSKLMLLFLQQNLSIALGVLIIIYVILPKKIKVEIYDSIFVKKVTSYLVSRFAILTTKKTFLSLFIIGLLNGLLPCGFVYMGIAGSISTGNWLSGMIYMILFGLGTFPIMFAASILGKIININIRRRINKLIPALAIILAFAFILRGLNLGIPYISPKLTSPNNMPVHQMKMH